MATLRAQNLGFLDWRDIDLSIGPGEIVAVYGKSGSGKSLLLRALADLIPWEGSVTLDGTACQSYAPESWRRKVAYVPAEILWWESVTRDHFERPIQSGYLERLNLPESCLDWEPSRLSMGERQRLGLLRALNRQPEVLLLDEPTANLDAEASSAVEELACDYLENEVEGGCAVWVTHDEAQRARLAKKAYVMEEKQLQTVGADD